jgi:predicted NBD/HSP70 family sugar kinase
LDGVTAPLRPLAVDLLRLAHLSPGITRADAARHLGIGTGAASELVASLLNAELLDEQAAQNSGRGRPTRELVASPQGPVLLAVAIRQTSWRLDAVSLGDRRLASVTKPHEDASGEATIAAIGAAVTAMRRRFPKRVRGLGIAAPGTVREERWLDAAMLGWRDLDLRRIWPKAPLFAAGNDATLAAVAEGLRGGARTSALSIYLHIEAGLGGAVLRHGAVVEGAHGLAGEFGHMPMGDPTVQCPCGASGCWGRSVDGTQFARVLGDPPPADVVAYAGQILTRAQAEDRAAQAAVKSAAQSLGRGTAGLVNALDADLVLLGGLAPAIVSAAPAGFESSYAAGLMASRRETPTLVQHAILGDEGPITGAAEIVWPLVWQQLSPGGAR